MRTATSILILSIVLAFVATPSHAEGTGAKANPYSLRLGRVNYKYEEPKLMSIQGTLYSLGTAYRRDLERPTIPMWFAVDFEAYIGKLTYDGGLTNGVTTIAITEKTNDQIYFLQGFFGTSFFNSSTKSLEVSAGPSLWILRDKIDGTGSYHREINQLLLHVDGDYKIKRGEHISLTAGLQLNLLLFGMVKSKLSDIDASLGDLTNIQTSGHGYKLHAAFEYATSGWTPFLDVYYRHWNIGDSNTADSTTGTTRGKEPANNTKMLGLNLGTKF